ncbi:MAG: Gfo/Idh/MocA family oxidoreductase [Treponema sp.]|nr:Gfo/Idh/MocA family oxidoreductase [Treponema sp.]
MKNIGIIGAGWIAQKMAITVQGLTDTACNYAIASRNLEKAREFAKAWGFKKAYGSYEELLKDPDVDLVYIATPHSEHYKHMKLCLDYKKPVLCEKAFTFNTAQAKEILDRAEKENILVTEAIWTRYMPSRNIINSVIESGKIGKITGLHASLHYNNHDKERMFKPELAGGALLDLGVYTLNFALMHFGTDIERIESNCKITDTNVDAFESITIYYNDGRVAFLDSGMFGRSDRQGILYGETGYAIIQNINNPSCIEIYSHEDKLLEKIEFPKQITGYEYQVIESLKALENNKIECDSMPHKETIRVMQIMDDLRVKWGLPLEI